MQRVLFHSWNARAAVRGSQHWKNPLPGSREQPLPLASQLWQLPLCGAGVPVAEGLGPVLGSGPGWIHGCASTVKRCSRGCSWAQAGLLHVPLLLSLFHLLEL